MGRPHAIRVTLAIVLCLGLVLGGQAVADSAVAGTAETNQQVVIGQAASSYLTGLRTFAAAILWNRLDVLSHSYYRDASLTEQRYILSTVAVVQALDPRAVQSYYIGSWILVRNDRVADGLAMAERGVEDNPTSGILRVNLAQLRILYQDDIAGAVDLARSVLELGDDAQWADPVEEHNGLSIMGAIFRAGGREDLDAQVQAILAHVDEEAGDALDDVDHDHDGDGVPDH